MYLKHLSEKFSAEKELHKIDTLTAFMSMTVPRRRA
jgi:hypothetical protein